MMTLNEKLAVSQQRGRLYRDGDLESLDRLRTISNFGMEAGRRKMT